jgi:hypothetical protein
MTNPECSKSTKPQVRPGLSIMVIPSTPFTPDVDDVAVSVAVDDLEWNRVEVRLDDRLSAGQMANALRAVARLLETTPGLLDAPNSGAILVEKENRNKTTQLVPSREGWLRADGVLEFPYVVPRK